MPIELETKNLEGQFEAFPNPMSSVPYNQYNRVARAVRFIDLARSQDFLPLKISFYIACLESLLTTDNTGVSHKVTERAVLILGGDFEEKQENFKLIKKHILLDLTIFMVKN